MDFLSDVIINMLAYRIGVRILAWLSKGRFKGENGFAWGLAVATGGLVLIAPFAAFFIWLIQIAGH